MTYELDENAKVFSYTRKELFECIAKIVAHPHSTVTPHDQARAAAIFLVIDDYLGNYTESDNNGGHYVYEGNSTDFEGFVMEMFNFKEYGEASAKELLK